MTQLIIATNLVATYSNALLALLLPQVAQFAEKLGIRERNCTVADVARFTPRSLSVGGGILFKNGNQYGLGNGTVQLFSRPHSYYGLQSPELLPRFYGAFNMTKAEAVEMARGIIRKLGYDQEQLFMDLEPEVETAESIGTNSIPHYRITWLMANESDAVSSVQIEINAAERKFESIFLPNPVLWRDPPLLPGMTLTNISSARQLPPEDARRHAAAAIPRLRAFAEALALPCTNSLTTNDITPRNFREEWDKAIVGEVKTPEGFVFEVAGGRVVSFDAPDKFFGSRPGVRVRDFVGEWKLTDQEVIDAARKAAIKIGVPAKLVAGPPKLSKPCAPARRLVPRCTLSWEKDAKAVFAEVDASSGTIKSLWLPSLVY